MDSFLEKLAAFLPGDVLVFGLVCFVLGVVIILLDWLLLSVRGDSVIEISYGTKSRFLVLLAWAAAAGVMGVLGGALSIVQLNFQAAVIVAVSWPIIFARLVEKSEQMVQQTTEEE